MLTLIALPAPPLVPMAPAAVRLSVPLLTAGGTRVTVGRAENQRACARFAQAASPLVQGLVHREGVRRGVDVEANQIIRRVNVTVCPRVETLVKAVPVTCSVPPAKVTPDVLAPRLFDAPTLSVPAEIVVPPV